MTVQLAPGAAFLLGMLCGTPRTADELHAMLPAAVELFDDFEAAVALSGPDLVATLLALYDAGPDEIARRLDRAVEFRLADRLDLDGSILYAAHRVVREPG